jgi:FMN phosphatase YigB (HAD superfamily)
MQNKIKVLLIDFSYTLCFPKTSDDIDSLSESNINVLDSFILNQELLDYLQTLKSNYKIHIFSSGIMHTDPDIKKVLQPIFDGYITSIDLKLPKSFPDAYKIIANKLGVNPDNILFIDDQQKNVAAAITAGSQALRYTNNQTVIKEIKKAIL